MLIVDTLEGALLFGFRLITAILFPVAVAICFYRADKKTKFKDWKYWPKQILIGIVFGFIACLATEFGIPVDGAVLNVRTASPITAGLLFGGPAGIIAGTIGAIHRWCAVWWGVGAYTRMACTLGTFIAGIVAAICREFVFNNKKTTWLYGFIIGVTIEVLHMLMVFFTHLDDLHQAFIVILKCAVPMILSNGISVMLALFIVTVMGTGKIKADEKEEKTITQTFQSALLLCVLFAFLITSGFTYSLQKRIALEEIETLLKLNLNAVPGAIDDVTTSTLLQYNSWMADEIDLAEKTDEKFYFDIQKEYEVLEMYVVDAKGIIQYAPFSKMVGTSIENYEQLKDFVILEEEDEHIREFERSFHDQATWMRYAGTALYNGGMIISGYDEDFLLEEVQRHISIAAKNRYIGETGYILIMDDTEEIISNGKKDIAKDDLTELGFSLKDKPADTVFKEKVYGEKVFCMYVTLNNIRGNYHIVAVYPEEEALFSQRSAVYLGIFMEILVFAVLFMQIYFLIKRGIISNIHDINNSLAEITSGNLDVKVEVRENKEFASLSNDINATVAALKKYIEEAAARIDKELLFAKAIQTSSLRSVFPAFPKRKDFDIYASMRAAKEVGGDFYDFYLLDNEHLGFIMADVSGKGIPAAMFMMTAKSIIKGYAERGLEVHEILEKTNDELCEGNEAEMFVTAWMGILNLSTGVLTFTNAGHNPPLIQRKNGEFEYLKTKANLALAIMDGVPYTKQEIELQPGDAIYLYTDGVTEATNGSIELYGEERLKNSLNLVQNETTEQRCKRIIEGIDAFVGTAEQFDDITMLSINYFGTNGQV